MRIFTNGRIFTSAHDDDTLHDALVVDGDRIAFVGSNADAAAAAPDAEVVDLAGRVVLPGILDGHIHTLQFGSFLTRFVCLEKTAAEVQDLVRERKRATPDAKFLLGASFLYDTLGVPPTKEILDAAEPDTPVFIDSADLHSCWVNSAALRALGITRETPDPPGGEIERDADGEATGFLKENAFHTIVWPYLSENTSKDERKAALKLAFEGFLSTGVTGGVDMAMMEDSLEAMEEMYEEMGGRLPIRINAHWFINSLGTQADHAAQVRRAAAERERLKSKAPWLNVIGIKTISDGVVDSCTAYMKDPYPDGSKPGPIWPKDDLTAVFVLADSLGLQIACHALGDAASEQALDAFEAAIAANGPRDRRHRMEHLESITPESVARLTRLGIVASLQPLHADPVYMANWRKMLGYDARTDQAFPWHEFQKAGSRISFGTDAPVAPHHAFPNLYTATTRRSGVNARMGAPTDPRLLAMEKFAFPLAVSIRHYTAGTAYSVRQEGEYGSLEKGKSADFAVININPFRDGVNSLREAQAGVDETWIGGECVWRREA
ncbi:amidohydrolase family protein [Cutaneotrichosporon oleaginosum]|uniref:Amidohydrolase family protein n=1 Tax=Cutaneotrichosporon oleaginosum TaxID=879819 RepID=A0A0J0XJS2_9TREE|nr:amidohydrolase family protein [Cutaneotrichosporon oleaginosum]KLT41301.1 amidohydrolase family protein [Cutaneotrichosporon oleaginosum]TXT14051.1 hypothetical protein COLE_00244 [Cutaneotrichosporon oleaginosum]